MKKTSLKSQIFLQPIILLTFAFIVLYFTVNFVMQVYVKQITSKSIADEFKYIEQYYSDEEIFSTGVLNDDSFIFPINHIIMDRKGHVISDSFYYAEEKETREKQIVNYFVENENLMKDNTTVSLKKYGRGYFCKIKSFDISSSEFLKSRAGSGIYYAIVFVDITPIEMLHKLLYIVLALSMIGVAIPGILISFNSSCKIDFSLTKLKSYIEQLGKREDINITPLGYEEFDEMLDTIYSISKRLDEAESSRRIFFQNASHELRTPLMSIQGYAEGIQKNIGENNIESAGIILSESRKMKSLVDDILTLSRIETGTETIDAEMMDIREMIDSCIGSVEKLALKKNLEINCDFSYPLILYADESKLSHALLNILSNAVRYAQTKVDINYYKENSENMIISISNDGESIETNDLPHIFDRFFKGKGGNFGIGLSLTKEIISLHGGEVWVESDDEKTTFFIRLPISYSPYAIGIHPGR